MSKKSLESNQVSKLSVAYR